VSERRFPEAWRPVEEHMVERFSTVERGPDEHTEVLAQAILTDHLVEGAGPQLLFVTHFLG
jgi:hypothetical protein